MFSLDKYLKFHTFCILCLSGRRHLYLNFKMARGIIFCRVLQVLSSSNYVVLCFFRKKRKHFTIIMAVVCIYA